MKGNGPLSLARTPPSTGGRVVASVMGAFWSEGEELSDDDGDIEEEEEEVVAGVGDTGSHGRSLSSPSRVPDASAAGARRGGGVGKGNEKVGRRSGKAARGGLPAHGSDSSDVGSDSDGLGGNGATGSSEEEGVRRRRWHLGDGGVRPSPASRRTASSFKSSRLFGSAGESAVGDMASLAPFTAMLEDIAPPHHGHGFGQEAVPLGDSSSAPSSTLSGLMGRGGPSGFASEVDGAAAAELLSALAVVAAGAAAGDGSGRAAGAVGAAAAAAGAEALAALRATDPGLLREVCLLWGQALVRSWEVPGPVLVRACPLRLRTTTLLFFSPVGPGRICS